MEFLNIKGVIFDFDGVIVDSENSWPAVENPYIRQHTTGWSDGFYADLIGMGLSEVYGYLSSRFSFDVSKEQYFADYDRLALGLYGAVAEPIEGIIELLDSLKGRGLRLDIASSSKPTWIRMALDRHGMSGYFETITSSHDEDVDRGKPEPDVYLRALQKQALATNEVIAIEDSRNGITAATSAGIFCVGVNINGTNSQDISNSNLKINRYSELLQLFY